MNSHNIVPIDDTYTVPSDNFLGGGARQTERIFKSSVFYLVALLNSEVGE